MSLVALASSQRVCRTPLLTPLTETLFLLSKRQHFINIPLQGNPVQEYTHTAHILSREYHFSVSDPKAITEEGAQILHKASVDYYRRSFSQDSVDATESTPPVFRASSVDQYYTTQDYLVPTTPLLKYGEEEDCRRNNVKNTSEKSGVSFLLPRSARREHDRERQLRRTSVGPLGSLHPSPAASQ